MGVFNCPDCGSIVSEHATSCPTCGCPFNRSDNVQIRKVTVTRKSGFNGAARKFEVVIDGTIVAILKMGETASVNIDGNNRHSIYACLHTALERVGEAPIAGNSKALSERLEIGIGGNPINFEIAPGALHLKLKQI